MMTTSTGQGNSAHSRPWEWPVRIATNPATMAAFYT